VGVGSHTVQSLLVVMHATRSVVLPSKVNLFVNLDIATKRAYSPSSNNQIHAQLSIMAVPILKVLGSVCCKHWAQSGNNLSRRKVCCKLR
jgi:hypothetical protein